MMFQGELSPDGTVESMRGCCSSETALYSVDL